MNFEQALEMYTNILYFHFSICVCLSLIFVVTFIYWFLSAYTITLLFLLWFIPLVICVFLISLIIFCIITCLPLTIKYCDNKMDVYSYKD